MSLTVMHDRSLRYCPIGGPRTINMKLFSRTRAECTHVSDHVAEPRTQHCQECGSTFNLRICTECGTWAAANRRWDTTPRTRALAAIR